MLAVMSQVRGVSILGVLHAPTQVQMLSKMQPRRRQDRRLLSTSSPSESRNLSASRPSR